LKKPLTTEFFSAKVWRSQFRPKPTNQQTDNMNTESTKENTEETQVEETTVGSTTRVEKTREQMKAEQKALREQKSAAHKVNLKLQSIFFDEQTVPEAVIVRSKWQTRMNFRGAIKVYTTIDPRELTKENSINMFADFAKFLENYRNKKALAITEQEMESINSMFGVTSTFAIIRQKLHEQVSVRHFFLGASWGVKNSGKRVATVSAEANIGEVFNGILDGISNLLSSEGVAAEQGKKAASVISNRVLSMLLKMFAVDEFPDVEHIQAAMGNGVSSVVSGALSTPGRVETAKSISDAREMPVWPAKQHPSQPPAPSENGKGVSDI
jgi:hypothetical protein